MIEAVFEDPAVKAQVFAEIEPHLAPDALLGSNTSTLPITDLAEGVTRPAEFIGLHFFSPVDKMPLLEIIKGEKTNEETLYRALDLAKQIKKTPIVVNDSRGFFTSRVIGTFINEGVGMLLEGVPAASIEQASSQAGYPAPVLQLSDELNLNLARKIRDATKAAIEAEGGVFEERTSFQVVDRLLEQGRGGRLAGAGYYDYEDGKRAGLWKGLKELFPEIEDPSSLSLRDLEERMLFIESIEAVKCLDEGVIETAADANIGSILGIGFPGWTGGVLQYIDGYEGPAARDRRLRGPRPRARGTVRRALRAARLAAREGRAGRALQRVGGPGRGARLSRPASATDRRAPTDGGAADVRIHPHRRAAGLRRGDSRPRPAGVRHARAARRPHQAQHRAPQPGAVPAGRRAGLAGGRDPRRSSAGPAAGLVDLCLFLEEISRGQVPIGGFSVSAISAGPYERFGTDEQKQEILDRHRRRRGGGDRDVRARGRLRRGQPALQGRAAQRRLRDQRPEDVDLRGPARRAHPARVPHRGRLATSTRA